VSIALGAFLAGLVIADSEYSLAALEASCRSATCSPRSIFVSIGMLLDAGYFLAHLPLVAGWPSRHGRQGPAGGCAARSLGYPLRTDVLSGLALCQVGEFSFILAGAGLAGGLIGQNGNQLFLAASTCPWP
jgi:CPA2 family monovalent cation:H+ antiporter-2